MSYVLRRFENIGHMFALIIAMIVLLVMQGVRMFLQLSERFAKSMEGALEMHSPSKLSFCRGDLKILTGQSKLGSKSHKSVLTMH